MHLISTYGTGVMLAAVGHGNVHALVLVLAVLFVLGALYLLFALQNVVGAVIAVVLAIVIVAFLA